MMNKLEYINQIAPYIDDAFRAFYDGMLSDSKLSMFFKDEAQIKNLITMQKAHFFKTLEMSIAEIEKAYVKLGEYHYDMRIPYVDFIRAAQMLEEYFLVHTSKSEFSAEIMDDIFTYFKYMKSFTAKGYLNRMIVEDKKDIENFFNFSDGCKNIETITTASKIQWLRGVLYAIEKDEELDFDEMESVMDIWFKELSGISQEKKEFIDDLEKRIIINTQNLFYFLKKKDYLEILPLYSSLLSIYKLTLLLNNLLTVELASNTIENLRIDSLSKLLRKESFMEFLKNEIHYAQREEGYIFSVCYLDLDNFKYINDTFGHYSGDKVIEKFGEIIKNAIRGSDMAFRIGGDEFAIIFKKARSQDAARVCEKIRTEFNSHKFVFNDNRVFTVGISVGVEEYEKESVVSFENMIERVDKKLYDAKKKGKNQVVF